MSVLRFPSSAGYRVLLLTLFRGKISGALVIRQVVVIVLSGFVSQSALIPYRRDGIPNGNRLRVMVRLFATLPVLRPQLLGAWAFVSDLLPLTFARS